MSEHLNQEPDGQDGAESECVRFAKQWPYHRHPDRDLRIIVERHAL